MSCACATMCMLIYPWAYFYTRLAHTKWYCRSCGWCPSVCSCRDFAYVARDNLTQVLKCHVFRCDSPAKNIATTLHEMCSKVSTPHGLLWMLCNYVLYVYVCFYFFNDLFSPSNMHTYWISSLFLFFSLLIHPQIMTERKLSKPCLSRLNSEPSKPMDIPVQGTAKLLIGTHVFHIRYIQSLQIIQRWILILQTPLTINCLPQNFLLLKTSYSRGSMFITLAVRRWPSQLVRDTWVKKASNNIV